MAESAIVQAIRKELTRRGAWTVKVHGSLMQAAGVPDILACYRGRFLGLEVKRPGNKASDGRDLQAYTLQEIRDAGGIAAFVYSVEDVIALLDTEFSDVRD